MLLPLPPLESNQLKLQLVALSSSLSPSLSYLPPFLSFSNSSQPMALLSQQLQRFLLTGLTQVSGIRPVGRTGIAINSSKSRSRCCSAIAIDAPSSLTGVSGIRWGYTSLQGLREEMEDDVVLRSDGLDGFSFAAVFDGHGGFSSVELLRDELFKECVKSLQGGLLLREKEINTIRDALQEAFANADAKLLNRLEMTPEDESGSTVTVLLLADDLLFISHVGDSSAVLSRSGKAEVLTDPHRPYGSSKISLNEIRRIREAGGWVVNGRICGDISVSRAFGDIRYKTKKNEMLKKGVEEGRWSEKFVSRVRFNNDLVIASPEVYSITLSSDAEFVVLASDGLWDYMNSSEAIDLVRNQLRQHGDVQLATEALAQAALVVVILINFLLMFYPVEAILIHSKLTCLQDRRSQDNVSIVIADLGRTDWQKLPLQKQNVFYDMIQALATIGIVSAGIWMSSQLTS